MRHLTAQMVADAINRAPNPFDSHDAEKSALRLHPVETAEEIVAKSHTPDPLRSFSAAFAQYVDRTFGGPSGQIVKTSKFDSENLGGQPSSNQQWLKLATPITVPACLVHGEDDEDIDMYSKPVAEGQTDQTEPDDNEAEGEFSEAWNSNPERSLLERALKMAGRLPDELDERRKQLLAQRGKVEPADLLAQMRSLNSDIEKHREDKK